VRYWIEKIKDLFSGGEPHRVNPIFQKDPIANFAAAPWLRLNQVSIYLIKKPVRIYLFTEATISLSLIKTNCDCILF
jgi:hypothetical protein